MSNVRSRLASARRRLLLALAAAAILVVGFAARPTPARPPVAIAEEAAAPILEEVVQQRQVTATFERLREQAAMALPFTVRVVVSREPPAAQWSDWNPADRPSSPARNGVVVAPDRLLVAGTDHPGDLALALGNGRVIIGRVTARYPDRGLSVVAVDGTQLATPPIAAALPQSGSVAFAAAPGVPPLVAPIFIAGVSGDTIIVTNPLDSFVGMPVFLDTGELAGIVAAGRGGLRVLSIAAAQRPPSGDTPYLGLSLQLGPIGAGETGPVVVSAVAADGIGHAAGLRESDVLIDVDGTAPADIAAAVSSLRQAAASDVPVPLRVRRGRLVVRLTLPTRPAP